MVYGPLKAFELAVRGGQGVDPGYPEVLRIASMVGLRAASGAANVSPFMATRNLSQITQCLLDRIKGCEIFYKENVSGWHWYMYSRLLQGDEACHRSFIVLEKEQWVKMIYL